MLTVRDLGRAVDFYTRVLGLRAVASDDGPTALHAGDQKINLHLAGREFTPHATHPVPGSGDLCLLTDVAPDGVIAHLARHGVPLVEGPVARAGARGPLVSVYVRDPDGNLVELGTPAG